MSEIFCEMCQWLKKEQCEKVKRYQQEVTRHSEKLNQQPSNDLKLNRFQSEI